MNISPLCDIHPEHGSMQIEPMYGSDGITIVQYGWFCHVKECDGYGGPVKSMKPAAKSNAVNDLIQETLF